VFWLIQFIVPSARGVMTYVYLLWCGFELVRMLLSRETPPAWIGLRETLARRFA